MKIEIIFVAMLVIISLFIGNLYFNEIQRIEDSAEVQQMPDGTWMSIIVYGNQEQITFYDDKLTAQQFNDEQVIIAKKAVFKSIIGVG